MGDDPKIDLKTLRDMIGVAEPAAEEPTPFARHVAEVLARALGQLREDGVLEVQAENCEALAAEVTRVALEASSPKRMSRQIVQGLIRSDLVEEVYGSDAEIASALQPFLDEL